LEFEGNQLTIEAYTVISGSEPQLEYSRTITK